MEVKIDYGNEIVKGKIIKKTVMPFGTSGHIPFPRKYVGKEVRIIVQSATWLLSDAEFESLVKFSEELLNKVKDINSEIRKSIRSLKEREFEKKDLKNIIKSLGDYKITEDKECSDLVSKIWKKYHLAC